MGRVRARQPDHAVLAVPGNHDWDVADLRAYTEIISRFQATSCYYDISLGLVHLFCVVDSDPREPDGTTAAFGAGALAPGRARLIQLLLQHRPLSHHPVYCRPHGSSLDMRWPFEQWGADVVLSAGHDHVYERLRSAKSRIYRGFGEQALSFRCDDLESRAQFNAPISAR